LGAAAIGAAVVLAPIASADTNPLVPNGTNPQVPNLGYYESNSGSQSAGDTTLGSLDLPFWYTTPHTGRFQSSGRPVTQGAGADR
jgi:hypothetical protein